MLVIDEQLGLTGAKPCAPALRRRRVDAPIVEKFILMWILCCLLCENITLLLIMKCVARCTAKKEDVLSDVNDKRKPNIMTSEHDVAAQSEAST